jgi:SAM-dependent methyltransferase
LCGHFLAVHAMGMHGLYTGDYVSSTYGEDGMQRAFERIIALPPAQSDNIGRVQRLLVFAAQHFPPTTFAARPPTVLDVGSGLCVFLYQMRLAGWQCTAIDPDARAARHARERVGVTAVCGDFMASQELGRFDVVTFNKVLEHVADPVSMLARSARHLREGGFVYIELPDGEAALTEGPERQEFFIDHWHVFSAASLAILATRAGFRLQALERLHEPSGKYTLRAFLVPVPDTTGRPPVDAERPVGQRTGMEHAPGTVYSVSIE